MPIKKSHIVFLASTLFICFALFAKIGERRLAADKDDWVRNDSTLTAHTIHCPEDSIQLECPPPWVKWYEVDFQDPETGECIFKDLGLMADTSKSNTRYECTALNLDHKKYLDKYIAYTRYEFIPDTNHNRLTFTDSFYVAVVIEKYKNIPDFYSLKQSFIRSLEKQKNTPMDSVFRRRYAVPQMIDAFYYQGSPAGSIEKQTSAAENVELGYFAHWVPRWSRGIWKTYIQVPYLINNNRQETLCFQDALIDNIMNYYRDLNRRHAKDPL